MLVSKDTPILISGSHDVTSQGKRDFAGVIKLRILGWGAYPALSMWTLNITASILIRARQREVAFSTSELFKEVTFKRIWKV